MSTKLDFEICTIPGQSKDSSDIEEIGEVINKAGPSKKMTDSDIEELDEAEDEEDDLMGDGEAGEEEGEEEEESEEGMQSYTFWLYSVLLGVRIGCNSHKRLLMPE